MVEYAIAIVGGVGVFLLAQLVMVRRQRSRMPEEVLGDFVDQVGRMEERLKSDAALRTREMAALVMDLRDSIDRSKTESGERERLQWDRLIDRLQGYGREQREESARSRVEVEIRLREMQTGNEGKLEQVRVLLDQKLRELQSANERKLDEMRQIVDEKLQSTIQAKLGESFKLVQDRLESVHRGLGEMQSLASDVGSLNRIFSNVKIRGVYGEAQLRRILEELLTSDQFVENYRPNGSTETVEFAIKLPGPKEDRSAAVYIPLDAKFPKEDYERLVLASESGASEGVDACRRALLKRIEGCAADIQAKYIRPPATTGFAIMFLATEGLFAEALREPGFQDKIRSKYQVILTGPTTLAALLNSLSVGFQTVAIEQRSSEIRAVLGAVRTEFATFTQVLERVKKQLGAASNSIESTFRRTRAMERTLRHVEALPAERRTSVLEIEEELSEDVLGEV